MLWRSGRDRHGAGAADDMPASSSTESPASQVKLHVRGVSKTYGTSTVLKPLELKVMSGELLAVLGPSGSGKTTLLQIICGLVEPSGGRLIIDGRDGAEARHKKIDSMLSSVGLDASFKSRYVHELSGGQLAP